MIIKKRIKKKPSNFLFVISRHKLNYDHTIDWRNASILDSEQSYYKRMVSEMIHIKRQENGLNKQSDTECFPEIYLPIIEKNPNRTTFSTIFFSPFLSHYIKYCHELGSSDKNFSYHFFRLFLFFKLCYLLGVTFARICVKKYVVSEC